MPQLRKDPIVSRWVIVSTERARRPAAFADPVFHETPQDSCAFCHDTKSEELLVHGKVRVVKSGAAFFTDSADSNVRKNGLYQSCHSHGSHEVVIETPNHIANMADLPLKEIQAVLETYAMRMRHHH